MHTEVSLRGWQMQFFRTFTIYFALTSPTLLAARQFSTAQTKPMTNQDVVMLVTAKFDDTTITQRNEGPASASAVRQRQRGKKHLILHRQDF